MVSGGCTKGLPDQTLLVYAYAPRERRIIICKPYIARSKLEQAIRLLEEQWERSLHDGAQIFVTCKGQPLLDVAISEAQPGVPLHMDSVKRHLLLSLATFECTKEDDIITL